MTESDTMEQILPLWLYLDIEEEKREKEKRRKELGR
jgi:hypothetical protein